MHVRWAGCTARPEGARTEDIALVEAIGGNDCDVLEVLEQANGVLESRADALVMRRFGCPAPSMVRECAGGEG